MKGNIPILTSSRWNPHESSQIQPVYTKVHYIKIQLQKTTCSFQAEISPTHGGFCPILPFQLRLENPHCFMELSSWNMERKSWGNHLYWLVASTPLKNISQWEGLSHIMENKMFQTTNHYKYQGFFSKACLINWKSRQGCDKKKPGNAFRNCRCFRPPLKPVHPEWSMCPKFWSPKFRLALGIFKQASSDFQFWKHLLHQ